MCFNFEMRTSKRIRQQSRSRRYFIVGLLMMVLINRSYPYNSGMCDSSRTYQQEINPQGQNMETSLKPPYMKKVGQRGKIVIWIVDGTFVRAHLDEEFTNYGQHYGFKCVPKDEFWLDKEAQEDEQSFFIDHLLVEHRLMEKGVPYDKALEAADKKEMSERKKAGDMKKLTSGSNLPDPAKVHVRLWKKLENGISVWIVDGRLVRSVFDVDFTEGGHDCVYEFVPQNEVWIDNDLEEVERPYVLLHELHERNLMAKGWTYSKAHDDSSRIEYYCRHHPNELHLELAKEGWE
jgi:hypothetical protein